MVNVLLEPDAVRPTKKVPVFGSYAFVVISVVKANGALVLLPCTTIAAGRYAGIKRRNIIIFFIITSLIENALCSYGSTGSPRTG
jgi:hypothetical protein